MTKRFATCVAIVLSIVVPVTPVAQAASPTNYFRMVRPSTGQGGTTNPTTPDTGTLPPGSGVNDGPQTNDPPPAGPNSQQFALGTPGNARARTGSTFVLAIPVTGATGTVEWSDVGNPLPDGLALGQDGVISGTPGNVSRADGIQILAVDSSGQMSRTTPFSIDVRPVPGVTYGPATFGQVGTPFTLVPDVGDAYGSLSWRLATGTLPPGLDLDQATGSISGIPTEAGSYDGISAAVRDADGAEGISDAFGITVYPIPTLAYGSATLDLGQRYTFKVRSSGLTPPVSYALASKSGADNCSGPDDQGALTCSQSAGDGAVGTYTVNATDVNGRSALSQPVSFTNGVDSGFSVGAGRTVIRARSGSSFLGGASVSNAPGPVTFQALDPMPPGIFLDTDSGTFSSPDVPDAAVGSTDVRISGTTESGQVTQQATATYVFAVAPALAVSVPPAAGSARQGSPYMASGTVSNLIGGATPTMTSTGLPNGLRVTAVGPTYTISGIPTGAGTSQATVTATDPTDGASASTPAMTMVVYQALGFDSAPPAQSGTVGTQITAFSPPSVSGRVGTLAYALLQGSTDISGNLDATCKGLSFSTVTGQVTGKPTASCNPTLTYRVTDDGGDTPSLGVSALSAPFALAMTSPVPDAFSFPAASNVTGGTRVSSQPVTLTGMTAPGPVSVAGTGGYTVYLGVNGGVPSSTIPQTVPANATLVVSLDSAPGTNGGSRSATVTVGGVSGTWTATTTDTTPDAFAWSSLTGQQLGTLVTSAATTVGGLTAPATLAVSGAGAPTVSVDGGTFTPGPTTVSNGQAVRVRQTTSNQASTSVTATVSVGGVGGTFTATTGTSNPNPFNCSSGSNSVPSGSAGSEYYCDIYPTGMQVPGPLSVTGSFNRVYTDATGWTSSPPATIPANARVMVAVVAPGGGNGGTNVAYIKIGNQQIPFSVRAGDTQPNPYGWADSYGNFPQSFVTSGYIGISGYDTTTYVQVANGYVSVNGGPWSQNPVSISPGQSLAVAAVAPNAFSSSVTVYVSVGGVGATWTVYTQSNP